MNSVRAKGTKTRKKRVSGNLRPKFGQKYFESVKEKLEEEREGALSVGTMGHSAWERGISRSGEGENIQGRGRIQLRKESFVKKEEKT